jgi:hypothetical protein
MKKMIMLLGCIVALSGIVGAETTVKMDDGVKTERGWGFCDPLMQIMQMCKSSEKLPTGY